MLWVKVRVSRCVCGLVGLEGVMVDEVEGWLGLKGVAGWGEGLFG